MSGMDIATGQPLGGQASTSSERPPVAPDTQRYPAHPTPDAGPVADTTGQQQERLTAGRDAVAAAQAQAHAAEADRRAGYAADLAPMGASYGDEMTLPDVISDTSKHTGSPGAEGSGPAG